MQKIDNFISGFLILLKADRANAYEDEIYRMGIIGQFNLTFELAWKALQAVLSYYSTSVNGSPRETIRAAYKEKLISNVDVWFDMLNRRNESIHIYDLSRIEKVLNSIFDSYIPVLQELVDALKNLPEYVEND